MEFLKDWLAPKCFSIVSYITSIFHLFSGVTLSGITGNIRSGEKRKFSCNVGENAPNSDKTYVETACYTKYNQIYNSPLPFYGFVLLSYAVVLVVYISYSILVKSRVEEVERSASTTDQAQDDDEGANQAEKVQQRQRSRFVCYSYVLHLFFRFLLGVFFTVLQYIVFYPLGFDSEFTCDLKEEAESSNKDNFTSTNCHCSTASEKIVWRETVASLNILFALIALGEAIYLVYTIWQYRRDGRRFEYVFCNVYLLRKSTKYTSIEMPLILTETAWLNLYKGQVLNAFQQTEIQCGQNLNVSLKDMYVDLIIHSGRAQHEFSKDMKRHEIYDIYLEPPQNSIPINTIKDLFNPNADTEMNTPRTILIVGRPGIGKTSLCKKIIYDWATAEADEFYSGKIVFFFKFRWFNSAKYCREMNIKELLRFGTQVDDATFEKVFEEVSAYPTKAIIIFDGLDEARDDEDSDCFTDEERVPNDCDKKMTVLTLFIKLVLGKLLEGATVLMTTRPTTHHIYSRLGFQREVEILGFTRDKIEEYVEKFCKNSESTDSKKKLWNNIKTSPELLNLCYIPVNCYIICATLFHDIVKMTNHDSLPKTLTELYKRALKFFFKQHGNSKQCVDSTAELDKLSFLGIEKSRLIFDEAEVDEHMKNSGLLNSLPSPGDELQYCFIHLTIQEFLAAKHVVETKSPEEINKLISSKVEDGKWHLVIQFVAGLLGDKMRKVDVSCKEFVLSFFESFIGKVKELEILIMICLKELNNDDIVKELVSKKLKNSFHEMADFSGGRLTASEYFAVMYVLRYVNNLRILKLSSNDLDEIGCLELGKLFQERCLEELSVNYCKINYSGLKLLVTAALEMKCNLNHEHYKLTYIDLGGNRITNELNEGVSLLSNFLRNEQCTLTELNLERHYIADNGVKSLCDALKDKRCKLTILHLSGNKITVEGASLLGDALKDEHCNLAKIDLRDNEIGDEGASSLFVALKHEHCKITVLNLSSNKITDQGLSFMCDVLKHEHCKITQLNLKSNKITDQGLSLSVDALKHKHCRLTVLNLCNNKITDAGVSFLCDALKDEHCKLTELNLSCNEITDAGASLLGDALKYEHCNLRYLDLEFNQINWQVEEKLINNSKCKVSC